MKLANKINKEEKFETLVCVVVFFCCMKHRCGSLHDSGVVVRSELEFQVRIVYITDVKHSNFTFFFFGTVGQSESDFHVWCECLH